MAALQSVALASLFGTLLYEYSVDIPQYKDIQNTSKVILGIASTQYIGTLVTRGSPISEQLRYLDWFLTTPLLLRMIYLYIKTKVRSQRVLRLFFPVLLFNTMMITLGYLAQYVFPQYRIALSILAFICLLFVEMWIVYVWQQVSPLLVGRQRSLFGIILSFILFTWPFYGIAFFFPERVRSDTYSILDIINKAVFSLVFISLIREEATNTGQVQAI